MLRFASDENFSGHIVRILRTRLPSIDLVRVQDTEFCGAKDPGLLAWCELSNEYDSAMLQKRSRISPASEWPLDCQCPACCSAISMRRRERLPTTSLTLATCRRQEDWANQVWHLPL